MDGTCLVGRACIYWKGRGFVHFQMEQVTCSPSKQICDSYTKSNVCFVSQVHVEDEDFDFEQEEPAPEHPCMP